MMTPRTGFTALWLTKVGQGVKEVEDGFYRAAGLTAADHPRRNTQ